jgi:hypothetical protein
MFVSWIAAVFALLPQLTKNFFVINWLDAVGPDECDNKNIAGGWNGR